MALRDLTTDLKSLKFEFGLNRKPFVVKDVDQRGGRNSAIDVIGIQAAKRADDIIRMAKLVVAKPGLTHAAKQALYNTISAAETGKLYDNADKTILKNAEDILLNTVTNTAQTAVNGLGIHEFKGKLSEDENDRQYLKPIHETVKKKMRSPSHSTQISQGVQKSKKLKIAETPEYGKIDYLTKPNNSNVYDVVNYNEGDIDESNDTIPFGFKIIGGKSMQFRAYLSTLSDSYSGQWNKTQMLGRPENFKSYNGFERNINLGFKIAAETRKDLLPLYRKLNRLASTTAPTFDSTGYFMRGTLVKVRVGDYFHNQVCNVENVAFSWAIDYPWEVKLQGDKEKDVQILPHVLDVSLTLGAIHSFVPTAGDAPFIGFHDWDEEKKSPGPLSLFQKVEALNPDRIFNPQSDT